MNMKYDKEVLTINNILTALDNFENKEEIINAIKRSLYDIETDWHHEEYLKHQLQSYKQKEDKLRAYIGENAFYRDNLDNQIYVNYEHNTDRTSMVESDNILAILNEGDK